MPDYTITIKTQSIYGPYTFPNPGALRDAFLSGKLPLKEEEAQELDRLTGLTVKEVKEEK